MQSIKHLCLPWAHEGKMLAKLYNWREKEEKKHQRAQMHLVYN